VTKRKFEEHMQSRQRFQQQHVACSQSSIAWSQDIVVDYVTTMMHKAMDESTKRGKLATEDLVYLVRKVSTRFGTSASQY
jgi:Transcription initiation factor IID, 18kD subunit